MISRDALPSDSVALASVHRNCFEIAWREEEFLDFIKENIVMVVGQPITGFIIARHILDEAEIISLAVSPCARNMGIGTALLAEACDQLSQLGVRRIFLEVAQDNHSALTLYHRAGFSHVNLRKAYYRRSVGPAVDAVIMSRNLDITPIVTSN